MRKRSKGYRTILSVMLVIILIASRCSLVFAATARATTMKLEKTEGTVRVTTLNGAVRKITNGMRLYNGNFVETQKASYAFISLDSSKAVKLDQTSNAYFRQNGKKLELLVKKGQLFFNVSTKLKENESMNIRTSTMVTGVRGTCGIVEVVSQRVSKLYLLEGKVVLGGDHPVTVHGGELAMVDTTTLKDQPIVVTKMQETDIPVFAVKEVLKDPVLQNKIEKNTDLTIEKMEEVLEAALQTPEKPEEEKPVEPEKPVQPDTPEATVSPTQPDTPNMPNNPVNPDTSGNPETPDTPDVPDTPETPGTPGNPDVPEASDTPNTPDTPGSPETPNTPNTPSTPDAPDTPDIPSTPDAPDTPPEEEIPTEPDTPDSPDTPSEGETPSESDTPGNPDTPSDEETPPEAESPGDSTEQEKPSEDNPPSDNTGETNPPSDNTEETPPSSDNIEETPPSSDDTGNTNPPSGDSSDENETEPGVPTEPVIPEEPSAAVTLTGDLTVDNIENALSGNSVVKIASTGTITMTSQSITIPTGRTLIIDTVFASTDTGGYKGFYMDKESKIIVEPNAVLYINGNIMGGNIELIDGALYNKGTIDGEAMTASGMVTIINNNIIKLQQAFTISDSVTKVNYHGNADSVLISNAESTAMPTEEGSSGTLLAYAVSENSTADGIAELETVQFIYADYLNSNVSNYMKLLYEKYSNLTWEISKEAVEPPAATT